MYKNLINLLQFWFIIVCLSLPLSCSLADLFLLLGLRHLVFKYSRAVGNLLFPSCQTLLLTGCGSLKSARAGISILRVLDR